MTLSDEARHVLVGEAEAVVRGYFDGIRGSVSHANDGITSSAAPCPAYSFVARLYDSPLQLAWPQQVTTGAGGA
jgi:hypothetical protein